MLIIKTCLYWLTKLADNVIKSIKNQKLLTQTSAAVRLFGISASARRTHTAAAAVVTSAWTCCDIQQRASRQITCANSDL